MSRLEQQLAEILLYQEAKEQSYTNLDHTDLSSRLDAAFRPDREIEPESAERLRHQQFSNALSNIVGEMRLRGEELPSPTSPAPRSPNPIIAENTPGDRILAEVQQMFFNALSQYIERAGSRDLGAEVLEHLEQRFAQLVRNAAIEFECFDPKEALTLTKKESCDEALRIAMGSVILNTLLEDAPEAVHSQIVGIVPEIADLLALSTEGGIRRTQLPEE